MAPTSDATKVQRTHSNLGDRIRELLGLDPPRSRREIFLSSGNLATQNSGPGPASLPVQLSRSLSSHSGRQSSPNRNSPRSRLPHGLYLPVLRSRSSNRYAANINNNNNNNNHSIVNNNNLYGGGKGIYKLESTYQQRNSSCPECCASPPNPGGRGPGPPGGREPAPYPGQAGVPPLPRKSSHSARSKTGRSESAKSAGEDKQQPTRKDSKSSGVGNGGKTSSAIAGGGSGRKPSEQLRNSVYDDLLCRTGQPLSLPNLPRNAGNRHSIHFDSIEHALSGLETLDMPVRKKTWPVEQAIESCYSCSLLQAAAYYSHHHPSCHSGGHAQEGAAAYSCQPVYSAKRKAGVSHGSGVAAPQPADNLYQQQKPGKSNKQAASDAKGEPCPEHHHHHHLDHVHLHPLAPPPPHHHGGQYHLHHHHHQPPLAEGQRRPTHHYHSGPTSSNTANNNNNNINGTGSANQSAGSAHARGEAVVCCCMAAPLPPAPHQTANGGEGPAQFCYSSQREQCCTNSREQGPEQSEQPQTTEGRDRQVNTHIPSMETHRQEWRGVSGVPGLGVSVAIPSPHPVHLQEWDSLAPNGHWHSNKQANNSAASKLELPRILSPRSSSCRSSGRSTASSALGFSSGSSSSAKYSNRSDSVFSSPPSGLGPGPPAQNAGLPRLGGLARPDKGLLKNPGTPQSSDPSQQAKLNRRSLIVPQCDCVCTCDQIVVGGGEYYDQQDRDKHPEKRPHQLTITGLKDRRRQQPNNNNNNNSHSNANNNANRRRVMFTDECDQNRPTREDNKDADNRDEDDNRLEADDAGNDSWSDNEQDGGRAPLRHRQRLRNEHQLQQQQQRRNAAKNGTNGVLSRLLEPSGGVGQVCRCGFQSGCVPDAHYQSPKEVDGDYSYAYSDSVSPAFLIRINASLEYSSSSENIYEEITDDGNHEHNNSSNSSSQDDAGPGHSINNNNASMSSLSSSSTTNRSTSSRNNSNSRPTEVNNGGGDNGPGGGPDPIKTLFQRAKETVRRSSRNMEQPRSARQNNNRNSWAGGMSVGAEDDTDGDVGGKERRDEEPASGGFHLSISKGRKKTLIGRAGIDWDCDGGPLPRSRENSSSNNGDEVKRSQERSLPNLKLDAEEARADQPGSSSSIADTDTQDDSGFHSGGTEEPNRRKKSSKGQKNASIRMNRCESLDFSPGGGGSGVSSMPHVGLPHQAGPAMAGQYKYSPHHHQQQLHHHHHHHHHPIYAMHPPPPSLPLPPPPTNASAGQANRKKSYLSRLVSLPFLKGNQSSASPNLHPGQLYGPNNNLEKFEEEHGRTFYL